MPDYAKHTRGLNDHDLCWLRHYRELRLKNMERVKAPAFILKESRDMVAATVTEMTHRNFPADRYKNYCDENWQEHADREINGEMKDRCLVWFRHLSNKDSLVKFVPAPCTSRNESCGPLCKEWVEATKEQRIRFFNNQDMDTGELLPYLED